MESLRLEIALLVLLAAFFHAAWNAVIKSAGDRLISMAITVGAGGLIALPIALYLPLPVPQAWPYLMASAIIHNVYFVMVVAMYRHGDLSLVYPLARGSAPLLVAVSAALAVGEVPGAMAAAGIGLTCAGILALGRRPRGVAFNGKAIGAALLTGVVIAGYTVVDGLAMRELDRVLPYIVWLNILDAPPLITATLLLRRRALLAGAPRQWKLGLAGGVLAFTAYGIAIYAMSEGAIAHVAALRETSVLFAALIGTYVLGEPLGRGRIIATAVIVAGIVLLQIS